MSEVDTLFAQAEALKDQGRLDEAAQAFEQVLLTDSTHVLSCLSLAVVYGRLGRHDEAVERARRACDLEPTDPFNFTALSVTYQRAWQGTQHQPYIQLAEAAMAQAHALQGRH